LDDYMKYEADCERIRQENGVLLDKFAKYLQTKKLSESTIKTHFSNADFYINEFLLYEKANEAKNGTSEIGTFLGHWFIRKAMWSSVNQIKVTAASLKKFYTFMYENGQIDKEKLDDLYDIIKDKMPDWVDDMKRYDAPSSWL